LRVFGELAEYSFHAQPKYQLTDSRKGQLETMLNAFIAGLHWLVWNTKRSRVEAEQQRIEQEKEAQYWRDLQKEHELEAERRKNIGGIVQSWVLARDLRLLVAEARKIASDAQREIVATGEFGKWLQWCESHADLIDPLSPLRKEAAGCCEDQSEYGSEDELPSDPEPQTASLEPPHQQR
jgi:hypothetical protein